MSGHTSFSPSASYRSLLCTPSLVRCAEVKEHASPYAAEGTEAHELCAFLIDKALGRDVTDPTGNLEHYNEEMQSCAEGYASFIMEEMARARTPCPDVQVFVEQHVDISKWVPGCGGTADCIILADGTIEIVDFKYGVGVPVSATSEEFGGNTQLMCYALGALEMFDGIYDVDTVKMVIYQPRRENISLHVMSRTELLDWANNVLAPTARLALEGKGEYKAGEHCRFCRVKATCRKRAEYNLAVAKYDFEPPPDLQNHEIDAILMIANQLTAWITDIKDYALSEALKGTEFEHFKVVEGRSNRKFTSEDDVAKAVELAGFDPWDKKLKGITSMTALLGKERFEELLGSLTCKPQGKPTLVPKTDKRPEMKNTAKDDFKE